MKNTDSRQKAIWAATALAAVLALVVCILVIGRAYGSRGDSLSIAKYGELIDGINRTVDSIKEKMAAEPEIIDLETMAVKTTVLPRERKLVLNGVAWQENKPVAFLNDGVVGLGDEVDGLIVVGIYEESIKLIDRWGSSITVELYKEKEDGRSPK